MIPASAGVTQCAAVSASAAPTAADLARLIDRQTDREGFHPTAVASVRLLRVTQNLPRAPLMYEPGIVIVTQGAKIGYLGSEIYRYDATRYLVMSMPLPFECETHSSVEEPLLAILIGADIPLMQDILLHIDAHADSAARADKSLRPRDALGQLEAPMASVPLDEAIRDVTGRLLMALANPLDAQVLGQQLVRELMYRVLLGPQGAALRAVARRHNGFSRIASALRRIHLEYGTALDVDTLARDANMSVSTFHHNFKAVTFTSPLQYLKRVRLHKAQLLLQQDSAQIATAALSVGYESASQFSREYRRYFGRSPREEANEVRRLETSEG